MTQSKRIHRYFLSCLMSLVHLIAFSATMVSVTAEAIEETIEQQIIQNHDCCDEERGDLQECECCSEDCCAQHIGHGACLSCVQIIKPREITLQEPQNVILEIETLTIGLHDRLIECGPGEPPEIF